MGCTDDFILSWYSLEMLSVEVNAMLDVLFQTSICLHSLAQLYFIFKYYM